mmetsp:Transcript_3560/g.5310  ORF Transcript_3560/g.5310 Transcript_3560/m.5310 type:complete len:534 (+) Transcript_3560:98-1699(+)
MRGDGKNHVTVSLHVAFVQASYSDNSRNITLSGRKGLALLETTPLRVPLESRRGIARHELNRKASRVKFSMILYEPEKKRRLVTMQVGPNLKFEARKGAEREMVFRDKSIQWSVLFHSEDTLDEFCKHLALLRHAVKNYEKKPKDHELIVQDCSCGLSNERMGITVDSVVKMTYSLWKIDPNHGRTIGKLLHSVEKRRIRLNIESSTSQSQNGGEEEKRETLPKGIELGILGLTKYSRRVLIIPPDLAGGHASDNSVIAYVKILSVKKWKPSREKRSRESIGTKSQGEIVSPASTTTHTPSKSQARKSQISLSNGVDNTVVNESHQKEADGEEQSNFTPIPASLPTSPSRSKHAATPVSSENSKLPKRMSASSVRRSSTESIRSLGDILHGISKSKTENVSRQDVNSQDSSEDEIIKQCCSRLLKSSKANFEKEINSIDDIEEAQKIIRELAIQNRTQRVSLDKKRDEDFVESVLRRCYREISKDLRQYFHDNQEDSGPTSSWKSFLFPGSAVLDFARTRLRAANEALKEALS